MKAKLQKKKENKNIAKEKNNKNEKKKGFLQN